MRSRRRTEPDPEPLMPGEQGSRPASGPLARRMAAGAGWAQVSRLAEVFSSLILSLLLVRALGPSRYGQYALIINAATMGAVILSLGFADTLMRFVSSLYARNAVAEVRFLVRRLIVIRLVTYAFGIGALALLRQPIASAFHLPLVAQFWIPIAALLVSQGAIEFATSFAYARLHSRDVAIARTIGQVVAVAFFVVMVQVGHSDAVTATLTIVISYLSATALLFLRGLGSTMLAGPGIPFRMATILGFAAAAWGVSLGAVGLAGQIDVILLGALRGSAVQIAYYSVATLIYVKLGTLLSGWAGTATSSAAELQAVRGPAATGRLLSAYVRVQVLLSLLVYPPIILLAPEIARRLFGQAYAGAGGLMAAYGGFWLVSAIAAAGIPLSFLLGLGQQRAALVIRVSTGLLNVALDVALIPPLGALGAVIATGIANGLAHLSDYVVAARRLSIGYPWTFALRVAAAAAIATIPGLLLPHSTIGLLAIGILYLGLFAGNLLLLRPLDPADVELLARVSPRAAALFSRFTSGRRPVRP